MQGQPIQCGSNECQYEVNFPQPFVIHSPCEFREPVVNSGENSKANGVEYDVMKMSDDEVSISYVDVNGCCAKHDPSDSSEDEIDQSTKYKEHGCAQSDFSLPIEFRATQKL